MAIQGNFPADFPSLMLDFANSKKLDPRITFTRASTGTYYDGVTTAMAEQNLIAQSQVFTGWSNITSTVTTNTTTAPDGTTTASTVVGSTGSSRIYYNTGIPAASKTFTFSIYLKAATNLTARIGMGSASVREILTQNVSVTTSWQRFTITVTALVTDTGALQTSIYGSDGTTGVSLDVWGAQVEQRDTVTAYTPTTGQFITNYIPVLRTAQAGQARFDHNPTTDDSLGLLIEEQRTNAQTYSEDFSAAVWFKDQLLAFGSGSTLNATVAPDGTLTADLITPNTTATYHRVYSTAGLNTTTIVMSAFVKSNGYSKVGLRESTSYGAGAAFDLSTGAVIGLVNAGAGVASNATITNVGNNWYRISCAVTAPSSINLTLGISVLSPTYVAGGPLLPNFAGDGWSGLFIWGAQLEAATFATSYIPTVASQVTRSADAAAITGTNFSQWYNQSEGTMYGEAKGYAGATVGNGGAAPTICTAWQSGYVSINLYRNDGSGTGYPAFVINPSSPEALLQNTSLTFNSGSEIGMVGTYKYNDAALSVNGLTTTTDTLVTLPTPTSFQIGRLGSLYTGYWNGTIKKIAYYPVRLPDAQLQALTS